MKIIAISGSIKTVNPSLNNALIQTVKELVGDDHEFEKLNISTLPVYSEDYDANFPEDAATVKQKIADADAIVIATPEHNRSVPTALKNVVDWASRPYGASVWKDKPVLIMGATGGALGTYGAQHHLRDMLAHGGSYVLPEPALYIVFAGDKITDGTISDEETRQHIKAGLDRLVDYAQQLQAK